MPDARIIGHISRATVVLAQQIKAQAAGRTVFAWIDGLGGVWVSDADPGAAAAVRIGCYRTPDDVLEDVYAAGAEYAAHLQPEPAARHR